MTFGERIISLRKKLKWSQDDLAKKVGTSAPIIGRYERNEIKPSIDTAKNIADALGVSIDYLISGSGSLVLDKKTLQRLEDIQLLDESKQHTLFDLIDTYIQNFKSKQVFK
ncbi:MAG: hypothetical protein KFKLKKLM_01357 [Flavobacteriales bacterium]|nr:hypothetical protein [Flavobacteriales bacterium]MBV6484839.1 hypothetical protein [Flavobacteriales bacterium]